MKRLLKPVKTPYWLLLLVAVEMLVGIDRLGVAEAADSPSNAIRTIPGKRLTLRTDVSGAEIDQLPELFVQAFPQWCRYFSVSEAKYQDWHFDGCLMKDKARFVAAGLLPDNLPPFAHGYSRDHQLWLYEQPSDYYRRHLLLHEGVHCFMFTVFGNAGPPWYMEGLAEYLGTHRLENGRLMMGYMPKNRDEVPEWGRVRIIQDAVAQRRALRLKSVIELPPTAHRETGPYAWCWAAVTLLDRHPRYRDRFHQLIKWVAKPDFNERFYKLFEPDWQELCEEWQLLVANMEYGYDVERCAVDFTPGKPLASAGGKATVAADRGWQNSGVRLEAGHTYQLTASGRYQVASQPKVWWCEPGGVSIRYYQGRPLGMLLAAVRPDHPEPNSTTALLRPKAIGLGATLTPQESGTLFLKINDSAGELDDNAGMVAVQILPIEGRFD